MNSLPEELLIHIFDNLTSSDLISLTLTCKLFNELISNTSRLLDKLTVYFPNEKTKDYDIIRKYKRMELTSNGEGKTLIPITSFGEFLKCLTIKHAGVIEFVMAKMLELCYNLEELNFINVTYVMDDRSIKVFPNLKKLKLSLKSSSLRLFKVVQKCNVEELILDTYGGSINDDISEDKLKIFFDNQPNLKKLRLMNIKNTLFKTNKLNEVKFQLEKLKLVNIASTHDEYFEKFLTNHRNSLKTLEIHDTKITYISKVLEKFKNLDELSLKMEDSFIRSLPKNENIKKLTIKRKRVPKTWLKKYPNVKILKIGE